MSFLPTTTRRTTSALLAVGLSLVLAGGTACAKDPERSVAAYCDQVTKVQGLDAILATGDAQRISEQVAQLRTLQQVAPADVEPSVAIVVSVADDLSRAVGSVPPDVAADQVFTRRKAEVPAIEAAGRTLEIYTFDNCKVNLTGTGVPGTGVPGTGTTVPTTVAGGGPPTSVAPSPSVTTALPKH